MADPKITVDIGANIDRLQRALGDATTELNGFGDRISNGIGRVGAVVAGAFAVDKLVDFGGAMLTMGTTVDTLNTKIDTVFAGKAGDMVNAWADDAAASLGITDTQLAGMAASMGDLLKPMGFSSDQAATMSTEMLDLAGALSAWSGGTRSAAEVSEILSAAMLGERDSLKSLGISIDAAEVQSRALAIAQAEGRTEATAMDEALATQQLILEKSADAQTAWADGSMDAVKTQNELRSTIAEFQETMAQKLYPIFVKVMSFIKDTAIPTLKRFGEWVSENREYLLAIGAAIVLALVPAFVAWAAGAASAAAATLAAVAPVLAIGAALAALAAGIVYAYQNWGWFRDAVDAVAKFLTDTVWPAIQNVAQWIGDAFGDMVDFFTTTVWPGIRDVIGFIVERFQNIVTIVRGVVDVVRGIFTGDFSRVWDGLKTMASGAVDYVVALFRDLPGRILGFLGNIGQAGIDVGAKLMSSLATGIGGLLSSAGGLAADLASAFGEALGDVWNSIARRIESGLQRAVDALDRVLGPFADFDNDLTDGMLPRFHTGGTFRAPTPGGQGLALLRDGEQISTPGRGPSGAMTVVLQVSERELGRVVVPALQSAARSGGPITLPVRFAST